MSLLSFLSKKASSGYSIFKKILLVFIVFYSVIALFIFFIKKDSPKITESPVERNRKVMYEKINDPELNKTEEGKIAIALYKGINCSLFGEICTDNPADTPQYKNDSFFGKVTNWVATPYSVPPASGIVWLHDGFQNSGLIPATYAAEGTGFASIKGYITIWKMFRNIAFLLLVLIMLIIGFLIMFRVKIDAQTVITLESALPRIVITMILISFSFAIAGFLIDLMYVLMGISVDLIMGYGMGHSVETVLVYQNDFMGAGFADLWPMGEAGWSFFGVGSSFWNMIPLEFRVLLDGIVVTGLGNYVVNANLGKWSSLFSAPRNLIIAGFSLGYLPDLLRLIIVLISTGWVVAILPGIILGVIIIFTILFLMFRLFFILLSSYIKVILYIIFAPIIILFEALPGQSSFNWWIRNMIGELIAFPTVVIMMLVGNAIIYINSNLSFWGKLSPLNAVGGESIIFPANNTFILPFLYGFRPEDFNLIVGLGVILLIPDFIKIVKGFVGAGESPLNLSASTFFAGGSLLVGGAFGGISSLNSLKHTMIGGSPYHGALDSFGGGKLAATLRKRFDASSPIQGNEGK